jgi:hypothetical protein
VRIGQLDTDDAADEAEADEFAHLVPVFADDEAEEVDIDHSEEEDD